MEEAVGMTPAQVAEMATRPIVAPMLIQGRDFTSRWVDGYEVFTRKSDGAEFVRTGAYDEPHLVHQPATKGLPLTSLTRREDAKISRKSRRPA